MPYKENSELGPSAQIEICVFLDQSKSKIPYALLNSKWNVESDENVSLHFDRGIRAQNASLQPRMLQIHLLCEGMLEMSFRTSCPTFHRAAQNTEAALVTVTQPRNGGKICGCTMRA